MDRKVGWVPYSQSPQKFREVTALQTISAIGSDHCGGKLYAGSMGRPAENFALLHGLSTWGPRRAARGLRKQG